MDFIKALLPGLAALPNIHPLFVHFPIAFWIGALLLEGLAVLRDEKLHEKLHGVAAWMLHLGTFCAMATALTGIIAEQNIATHDPLGHHGPAHEPIHVHRNWMLMTTALGLVVSGYFCWVQRRGQWASHRKGLLAAAGLLAVMVSLGADRGAQLVYEFGTGVNANVLRVPRDAQGTHPKQDDGHHDP